MFRHAWSREGKGRFTLILPSLEYRNEVHRGVTAISQGRVPSTGELFYAFAGPFHGSNVGFVLDGEIVIIDSRTDSQAHQVLVVEDENEISILVAFRSGDAGIFRYSLASSGEWMRKKLFTGPASFFARLNRDSIVSIGWGEIGNSDITIINEIGRK
jgi:hypothetical protein